MASRNALVKGLKSIIASPYDFPGSRIFKRGDTTPAETYVQQGLKKQMNTNKIVKPSVPKIFKPSKGSKIHGA